MVEGELQLGQVVSSRAGRDREKYFVVVRIDGGGHVYLADGKSRMVSHPKKKNIKHVIAHEQVAHDVAARLRDGRQVSDQDIRKVLGAVESKE